MSQSQELSSVDGIDGEFPVASSAPTPPRQLHRTFSHGSQPWSASDAPSHHQMATSYLSAPSHPASRHPAPILVRNTSNKREVRSTSVSSSRLTARGVGERGETFSEEDEEESEEFDGVRGKSIAVDNGISEEDIAESERDDDPITLKDRQSLINVEHPFGLPIWKPALYKKSRSVTRHADEALHSIPSAQAERHLLPGNIFWIMFFGWWLAISCFAVSLMLFVVPKGGKRYSSLVFGLGWYVAWPFGKYVEGDVGNPFIFEENDETITGRSAHEASDCRDFCETSSCAPAQFDRSNTRAYPRQSDSSDPLISGETTSLLPSPVTSNTGNLPIRLPKFYGATSLPPLHAYPTATRSLKQTSGEWLGKACFWLAFTAVIAPLMLVACVACWGLVITIPMAKLNWALLKHMFMHPTNIRFCAAPPAVVVSSSQDEPASAGAADSSFHPQISVKHPRLSAGQAAPSGSPTSTVLLCTYRAIGWQYYKYTVGGVNILFVNLLPIVFFVILDGFIILPMVERRQHVPILLSWIASRGLIFVLSLASVIPLSYFIGMAVASISAQSSIGMGAVINATFGSVIEIILYSIALTQEKGHLVEGSIVGSLLAGVLLMPGMSMCSGALRRKEQKFNAKSAGVTSMMLIMAIIGTLTPTLFYQTYGNFQLICSGCPTPTLASSESPWTCDHCYYKHPNPIDDPLYQSTVKQLMYLCAVILLFSYLVGLWFSLRTHASQIWQNPQQLLHPMELPVSSGHNRMSIYHRFAPGGGSSSGIARNRSLSLQCKPTSAGDEGTTPSHSQAPLPRGADHLQASSSDTSQKPMTQQPFPHLARRVSYATSAVLQPAFMPASESVDHIAKDNEVQDVQLPDNISPDDFTRAVAVATVNALRHQQTQFQAPGRVRVSGVTDCEGAGAHSGHDAPSWSRSTSASVLLACTALFALIAEILVDVVDVILEGSGIDEKFLGVTLFALVPNTTEFMNAISFALNGNIALSMEIGSAYALQVCLLQIPAMVAFSAWYNPSRAGTVANTFILIFPRWDVIVIILSVFLMTYTYIEAKSNYHRGSILVLSYLVLVAGFFFAPNANVDPDLGSFSHKFWMSIQFFMLS